mmetsp:Transcript_10833/g.18170  ORF Transcript_10833/g.18170 Transcript_10833/m.18170 type:complete len:256 (+) Transcript_10833:227-994(+)
MFLQDAFEACVHLRGYRMYAFRLSGGGETESTCRPLQEDSAWQVALIESGAPVKIGCHCWSGGCPYRESGYLRISRRHIELRALQCLCKREACTHRDEHREVGAGWEGVAMDKTTLRDEELKHAKEMCECRVHCRHRPDHSFVLDALQYVLLDLSKHVVNCSLFWCEPVKAWRDVAHIPLDRERFLQAAVLEGARWEEASVRKHRDVSTWCLAFVSICVSVVDDGQVANGSIQACELGATSHVEVCQPWRPRRHA